MTCATAMSFAARAVALDKPLSSMAIAKAPDARTISLQTIDGCAFGISAPWPYRQSDGHAPRLPRYGADIDVYPLFLLA
jgi:hypothetical protein